MKLSGYFLLCVLFFTLNGCAMFYDITVNDPQKMKMVKDYQGGTPVYAYIFGCTENQKIFADKDNSFWLYCESNSEKYGRSYQLLKIGPTPDKKQYYNSSATKGEIDGIRAQMKEIPLAPCSKSTLCVYDSVEPALLQLLKIGSETHIEYVDFSAKKELYSRVMNGEPVSLLTGANRAKPLERLLLPTIKENVFSGKNEESNRGLLSLVTGKQGKELDDFLAPFIAERKQFDSLMIREKRSWHRLPDGCVYRAPAFLGQYAGLEVDDSSIKWNGKCVDGKADGKGRVTLAGLDERKRTTNLWLEGTMVNGQFEGEYKVGRGNGYSPYYIHNDAGMTEKEYRKAQTDGTLDDRARQITLLACVKERDAECIERMVSLGADVNALAPDRESLLFTAVLEIREQKKETPQAVAAVRQLLEMGADKDYRWNPNPSLFNGEITALELLQATVTKGLMQLPPPSAPQTAALFSDPEVLEKNALQRDYARRAREIGMGLKEFREKLAGIEGLRRADTFESFAEAFLYSRVKDDFVKAQKLAKSPEQKRRLEYLAVLAAKNKGNIFDVRILQDGKEMKMTGNKNSENDVLGFFSEKVKTSFMHFQAKSTVAVKSKSPVAITNRYRVTVRYTLSVEVQTVSTVILAGTKVKTQTLSNTIEKSFVVGAKNGSKAVDLDFGKFSVAGSSSSAFGSSEGSLKGEPKLTAAIIAVEMVNE